MFDDEVVEDKKVEKKKVLPDFSISEYFLRYGAWKFAFRVPCENT